MRAGRKRPRRGRTSAALSPGQLWGMAVNTDKQWRIDNARDPLRECCGYKNQELRSASHATRRVTSAKASPFEA